MQHSRFTFIDVKERFKSLITGGEAFQFGMSDIARIRKEMGRLIGGLSEPYLQMKEREKAAKKKAKRKVIAGSKTDEKAAPSDRKPDELADDAVVTNADSTTALGDAGKKNAQSKTPAAESDRSGENLDGISKEIAVKKEESDDGSSQSEVAKAADAASHEKIKVESDDESMECADAAALTGGSAILEMAPEIVEGAIGGSSAASDTDVGKDEMGDTVMAPSDEKENVSDSQDNSLRDFPEPDDKLSRTQDGQESDNSEAPRLKQVTSGLL